VIKLNFSSGVIADMVEGRVDDDSRGNKFSRLFEYYSWLQSKLVQRILGCAPKYYPVLDGSVLSKAMGNVSEAVTVLRMT
jgi:hypothetical protein